MTFNIAFVLIVVILMMTAIIMEIAGVGIIVQNLIVYGPGGYKFKDYLRVGIQLTVLMMVVTITMTKIVWLS